MEFEKFWNLLAKELKKPKTFCTVTNKEYKAIFEDKRIRFMFEDLQSRVEYKKSFKDCFNLFFTNPMRKEYIKYSHNASYVLPILRFYLK
jgi:hypothetical protein